MAPVESGDTSEPDSSVSAPVDETIEVLDGEPGQSADALEPAPEKVYSVFDRKTELVLPEGSEVSQLSDSGTPEHPAWEHQRSWRRVCVAGSGSTWPQLEEARRSTPGDDLERED